MASLAKRARRERLARMRGIGEEPAMPAYGHSVIMSDCPAPPASLKYIAQRQTIGVNSIGQFRFDDIPGTFCPIRMFIIGPDALLLDSVLSITSGVDNQIISGPVPAELFAPSNGCCPIYCWPCLCRPGVPFEVTVANATGPGNRDYTVALLGTYIDACDNTILPPCRPLTKIVGITFPGGVPAQQRATIDITTPGKFCPERLYISDSVSGTILVQDIQVGLKGQTIISGNGIPSDLYSIDNSCCVLQCTDCMCMPGVPLSLTVFNQEAEGSEIVRGALIGSYEPFC